ncbi:hypothetical protein [Deinococcus multiflagellatus]|uniref:Uncharacterized protein n=1 Tax=Deinococcus multiflagellatus TaxID=1656887 RepID=A0ABW1ZRM4_9DEIO
MTVVPWRAARLDRVSPALTVMLAAEPREIKTAAMSAAPNM